MMTATKEYPPVDWSKPIMLEGHGTLLRVVRGLNRDGDWVCELVEGAWPNGDRGARYFSGDGRCNVLGQDWRVVNVPETPDLSQQAAEVCTRLANCQPSSTKLWDLNNFKDGAFSTSPTRAFRQTIEICLKHIDALPDELREHIRPLSDDERLLRKAQEWAKKNYMFSAHVEVARDAFIAGASHKAAQS